MSVCLAVIIFFLLSIVLRFVTRQVVKVTGMDNAITRLIFIGTPSLSATNSEDTAIDIDWAALYPFKDRKKDTAATAAVSAAPTESKDEKPAANAQTDASAAAESKPAAAVKSAPALKSAVTKLTNITNRFLTPVNAVEDMIGTFSSDYLIGYQSLVEGAKAYDKAIGWNFASFSEYNGIVELSDGYLTSYVYKHNVTETASSVISLKDFCEEQGSRFLFVTTPFKVSEYDDAEISGTEDFANQNCNEMKYLMQAGGVDILDIRDIIHNEGLNNHSLFYRTDHHWLTTTGLWASQKMLERIESTYDWDCSSSQLSIDNFEQVVYEKWFLGSQGKKVTLAKTTPDDFTVLYPKFDTRLHYVIPALGMDTEGDYSITYNMDLIETKDYYSGNPYGGCNWGDSALHSIENLNAPNDKRVLIINESFGDAAVPALSLGFKHLDSIDLRYFNGSLETYIEETQPDLVIVMYCAATAGTAIDKASHASIYDFR